MHKVLYLLQLIANAHPESVRLLYQEYGISAAVSAKSIIDAYLVHGDPFLFKLFDIAWNGKNQVLSSADGEEETETTEVEVKEKNTVWNFFDNLVGTATNALSTSVTAYNTLSSIFGGNSIDTGTSTSTEAQLELQKEMLAMQIQANQAESENNTKTYLLIGAGLLVAGLVLVMLMKKK